MVIVPSPTPTPTPEEPKPTPIVEPVVIPSPEVIQPVVTPEPEVAIVGNRRKKLHQLGQIAGGESTPLATDLDSTGTKAPGGANNWTWVYIVTPIVIIGACVGVILLRKRNSEK